MSEPIGYLDCDAMIGAPKVPLPRVQPSVDDLLSEMKRLHVGKALVRHRVCAEAGPETGNALLLAETSGHEELLPVWMTPPDLLIEQGAPEATVDHMLAQGVAAGWMKPKVNNYLFEPWCCERMLAALQDRRVPLIIEWEDAGADQLHRVMAAFPDLPVILLKTPRVGRNRILYPLLERHESLHVAVAPTYSVYRGIEELCAEFGSGRFLFGSGYPEVEGGAGVSMLTYAEVPDEDRRAMACGNLARLLEEVRR